MKRRRRYESLTSFYANPVRRRSRERDVGLRWRGADGSTYRAAVVVDTGELYSFQHLGADGRGGRVEVLGRLAPDRVDEALAGWRDVCGRPRSYEWLRSRRVTQAGA